jgi:hypothetical protein
LRPSSSNTRCAGTTTKGPNAKLCSSMDHPGVTAMVGLRKLNTPASRLKSFLLRFPFLHSAETSLRPVTPAFDHEADVAVP